MALSRLSTGELDEIAENGYAIVPSCLDALTLSELSDLFDASHVGVRNLLDLPMIRGLPRSSAVRGLMEPVIGPNCFAARGILFNKARRRERRKEAEATSGLSEKVDRARISKLVSETYLRFWRNPPAMLGPPQP